jgi:Cys-tRNA(Pro) deacylase
MSGKDFPITPAVRELKSKNIQFDSFLYDYEEKGGTKQTAKLLNVNEHEVIKTLIFDADGDLIIVLMHGDKEVSAKELARQLSMKKSETADAKKAMNATGYQFGGTSPFGLRKQLPVFIEKSIFDLKEIYINGGKRGYIIKIKTEDFGKVFNFETVEVAI